MSDVSGIPNMGFGGGNFFAPQFSYNPQMSAGQASAAYMPAENYAQNVTNNLFSSGGGFGRQTDYYSQLAANQLSGLTPYTFNETNAGTGMTVPQMYQTFQGGGPGGGTSLNTQAWDQSSAGPDWGPGTGFSTGGGGLFSGNANSLGGGGSGGYSGPTINWSGVGNAAADMSAPSGAQPFDWSHIFGGGEAKADPAPGMALPGGLGSPMTTPQQSAEPQQQQPGINWGNVGAAAGAGSTMPYTSGIEPDLTGGRTLTGDVAATATPQQQTTEPRAPEGPRTSDVKPTVESGGTSGTASQAPTYGSYGGNVFDYIQPGETQDAGKPASAVAEEARQRLAGIIGSPETAKAVEKAEAPGSMRDFQSPANDYSKFQQPGATALSDLSNLPPEFPDFTKLYPEYRGGAPASADEPAAGLPVARPEGADAPRPPADIFPERKLTRTGEEPQAFVVHHTEGRPTLEQTVADWRDPNSRSHGQLGAQYFMDRDAVIHDVAKETGYTSLAQTRAGNVPGAIGLNNDNVVGMEISARNDADVTPAQIAVLKEFMAARYSDTPAYGHKEIDSGKGEAEGFTGARAILADRPPIFNFDWSKAPIPDPAMRVVDPITGAMGPAAAAVRSPDTVNQGQVIPRPPADIPQPETAPQPEAVPLPTARPAAANIAQANSVLDSKISDLVQKNSPGDASRIPSSIANQTLREALGNTMTGGAIRAGIPPYLPQMGVTQAEFDKAYNSGLAVPPRVGGDAAQPPGAAGDRAPGYWDIPKENTPEWNAGVYEPALGSGIRQRGDESGADSGWSAFAQPGNVEDRRTEQLAPDTLAALKARGFSYAPGPEAASSPLGAALGLGDLPMPRGTAAGMARPQGIAGDGASYDDIFAANDAAASRDQLANVIGPRSSAFDLSPNGFGEGGYGNAFVNPGFDLGVPAARSGMTDYNTFQQIPRTPYDEYNDVLPDNLTPGDKATARNNNPGAQYPGDIATMYGATGQEDLLGGKYKIATFDTPIAGAAANFENLSQNYVGKTISKAISDWSGGLRSTIPGYSSDTVITQDMVRDPAFAIPFLQAIAKGEAPGNVAMSPRDWQKAHGIFTGKYPGD